MVLVWLWANKIKNAGVVDIFWSYNFPVIAVILMCLADGNPTRKMMICGMIGLAGFRLGTHLLLRVGRHLDEEEGRYAQLRKEWAPNPDRKFFWFFQMQALSNVLLAIPFFIVTTNSDQQISVLEWAGLVIWVIAFIGESVADWQLKEFKKDANNKGEVCDAGLWNYSRHPNYFFEWLCWLAFPVIGLSSEYPWGLATLAAPIFMYWILVFVTGIPPLEEQMLRSRGERYRAYQSRTSKFFPLPQGTA